MDHIWSSVVAHIGPLVHAIAVAATSWWAWRIYALLGGAIVVGGSIWVAQHQTAKLDELRPFRGRPPTAEESIRKRLQTVTQFRHNQAAVLGRRFFVVIICGFLLPSFVLLAGIHFYPWFRPGLAPLLLSQGCRQQAVSPSLWQTALYVGSQITMGVFDSRLSGGLVTGASLVHVGGNYLPGDRWVGATISAYRYFIGGFATLLLRLAAGAISAMSTAGQYEKDLKADLLALGKR